jgi:hypothetical protein
MRRCILLTIVLFAAHFATLAYGQATIAQANTYCWPSYRPSTGAALTQFDGPNAQDLFQALVSQLENDLVERRRLFEGHTVVQLEVSNISCCRFSPDSNRAIRDVVFVCRTKIQDLRELSFITSDPLIIGVGN